MNEGAPRRPYEKIQKASLEGNIRMPQHNLGIALFSLEQIFKEKDVLGAIDSLLGPIPVDDAMRTRVKRANAQHEHHGIGRELSTVDVQRVQLGGNYAALSVLSRIVGTYVDFSIPDKYQTMEFDEDGNWDRKDAPEQLEELKKAVAALSPEDIVFMQKLLGVATQAIAHGEYKEVTQQRRQVFSNWTQQDEYERQTSLRKAYNDARTVQRGIAELLETYGEDAGITPTQRAIRNGLVSMLRGEPVRIG